jgi:hypothetical protein
MSRLNTFWMVVLWLIVILLALDLFGGRRD